MGYYSDPTANMALGNIGREFSRKEKEAKRLLKLYNEGKLNEADLKKAGSRFKGLYRFVLENAIEGKLDQPTDTVTER